jgi:hypothetical protein
MALMLRYCPNICLKVLRKSTKCYDRIAGLWDRNLIWELMNTLKDYIQMDLGEIDVEVLN